MTRATAPIEVEEPSPVEFAGQSLRFPVAWVAPAIALASVAALAFAADVGPIAYWVPAAAAAVALAASILLDATKGRPYAIAAILVFVLLMMDAKFGERDAFQAFEVDHYVAFKVVTWVAILGVAAASLRRLSPVLLEPEVLLLSLYATIALASALWSEVPAFSGGAAIGLLAYGALACVVAVDLREDTAVRLLLFALVAFVGVAPVIAVVAPEIGWMTTWQEEADSGSRLQGFASHPNVLGALATLMIFMAMTARRNRLLGRIAFYGIVALGIAILLATGSRTAILAFVVAWGLVAARNSEIGRVVGVGAAGAASIVVVLAALGLLPDLGNVLGGFSRSGNASEIMTMTGRTDLWAFAWEKIAEKPFLGWGYFGTENLFTSNVDQKFADQARHAHNMFLQSLLSVGILGSLPGFAVLLLLAIRFVTKPDPTRDQITLLVLVSGLGEPGIFGMPVVATFFFYWIVARDATKRVTAKQILLEPAFDQTSPRAATMVAGRR